MVEERQLDTYCLHIGPVVFFGPGTLGVETVCMLAKNHRDKDDGLGNEHEYHLIDNVLLRVKIPDGVSVVAVVQLTDPEDMNDLFVPPVNGDH